MDDLAEISLGGDVTTDWCPGCRQLRQELERTRSENQLSCQMVKEKIINTDKLIKKYTAKCQECEALTRRVDEAAKKLVTYQRECDEMSTRLRDALQDVEPLRKYKARHDKDFKSREQKLEDAVNKVKGLESHIMQLTICVGQKDNELEKLLTSKSALDKRVSVQDAELKKLNDRLEKNKGMHRSQVDVKESNKQLTRQNRSLQAKLERYECVLMKEGFLTDTGKLRAKKPITLGRKRSTHASPLTATLKAEVFTDSSTDEEDIDVETIFRAVGLFKKQVPISCIDTIKAPVRPRDVLKTPERRRGFGGDAGNFLFSPISPALSPLPCSPAPRQVSDNESESSSNGDDDSDDLDDIAKQVDAQLLRRSPRHGTSPSRVADVKTTTPESEINRRKPLPKPKAVRTTRKPKPLANQDDSFLARRHSRTRLVAAHKATPTEEKSVANETLDDIAEQNEFTAAKSLSDTSDSDANGLDTSVPFSRDHDVTDEPQNSNTSHQEAATSETEIVTSQSETVTSETETVMSQTETVTSQTEIVTSQTETVMSDIKTVTSQKTVSIAQGQPISACQQTTSLSSKPKQSTRNTNDSSEHSIDSTGDKSLRDNKTSLNEESQRTEEELKPETIASLPVAAEISAARRRSRRLSKQETGSFDFSESEERIDEQKTPKVNEHRPMFASSDQSIVDAMDDKRSIEDMKMKVDDDAGTILGSNQTQEKLENSVPGFKMTESTDSKSADLSNIHSITTVDEAAKPVCDQAKDTSENTGESGDLLANLNKRHLEKETTENIKSISADLEVSSSEEETNQKSPRRSPRLSRQFSVTKSPTSSDVTEASSVTSQSGVTVNSELSSANPMMVVVSPDPSKVAEENATIVTSPVSKANSSVLSQSLISTNQIGGPINETNETKESVKITVRRTRSSGDQMCTLSESSDSETEQSAKQFSSRYVRSSGIDNLTASQRKTRSMSDNELDHLHANHSSKDSKFKQESIKNVGISETGSLNSSTLFKAPLPVSDNEGKCSDINRRLLRSKSLPESLESDFCKPVQSSLEPINYSKENEPVVEKPEQADSSVLNYNKTLSVQNSEKSQDAQDLSSKIDSNELPNISKMSKEKKENEVTNTSVQSESNENGGVISDSQTEIICASPERQQSMDFNAMSPFARHGPKDLPALLSPLPPTPMRSTSQESSASLDSMNSFETDDFRTKHDDVTLSSARNNLSSQNKSNVSRKPNSNETHGTSNNEVKIGVRSERSILSPTKTEILEEVATGVMSPKKGALHILGGNAKKSVRNLSMNDLTYDQAGSKKPNIAEHNSEINQDKSSGDGGKNVSKQLSAKDNKKGKAQKTKPTLNSDQTHSELKENQSKRQQQTTKVVAPRRSSTSQQQVDSHSVRNKSALPEKRPEAENEDIKVFDPRAHSKRVAHRPQCQDINTDAITNAINRVKQVVNKETKPKVENPTVTHSQTNQSRKRTVQLIDFIPEMPQVNKKRGRKGKNKSDSLESTQNTSQSQVSHETKISGSEKTQESNKSHKNSKTVKNKETDVQKPIAFVKGDSIHGNIPNYDHESTSYEKKPLPCVSNEPMKSPDPNQPMKSVSVTSAKKTRKASNSKNASSVPMKIPLSTNSLVQASPLDSRASEVQTSAKRITRKRSSGDSGKKSISEPTQSKVAKITATASAANPEQAKNVDRELQFVLRFKSVKVEDIAQRLCRLAPRVTAEVLAERVIHALSVCEKDLLEEAYTACNTMAGCSAVTWSALITEALSVCEKDLLEEAYTACNTMTGCSAVTWSALLTEEEARILQLLNTLHDKALVHDVINVFLNHACTTVTTSQSIHVFGKCAISRVIASLCHVTKQMARVRCFLYDVIYYDVIGAASLIGACAMVWPGCLVRTGSGIEQPVISIFEHILLRTGSSPLSAAREKLLVFLTTLCNWTLPVSSDSRDIVLDLVKVLESLGGASKEEKERCFECGKSLELVLRQEEWAWINTCFLYGVALPRLHMWLKTPARHVLLGQCMLRLLGAVCRRCPEEQSAQVRFIVDTIAQFCVGESCHKFDQESQWIAVHSISLLAPFCVAEATNICQQWLHSNIQTVTEGNKQHIHQLFLHYKPTLPHLNINF